MDESLIETHLYARNPLNTISSLDIYGPDTLTKDPVFLLILHIMYMNV